MKNLLGFVSFALIVGGISGLLSDHLGGFRLFGFVQYLVPGGHETAGYTGLVLLGTALAVVTGRIGRGR
ncbi:hypothetical protein ACFWJ4_39925 [Kitasatospora sp. NPDC127067]|uniref:hypothetical protein n=1 Tax=Kitasatospora sp. NPDC127067 TaxID=3347126 RepID=UPI003647604A